MKLLIGGAPTNMFHLKEIEKALTNLGVQCKLVLDSDISKGFPSKKISDWFQSKKKFDQLISEFKPDVILVDRQRHFARIASKSKIPLVIYLRGDIWKEFEWAKQTIYKSFVKRIVLQILISMAKETFEKSSLIVCVSKHLEKVVNENYPDKKTGVMYPMISPAIWHPVKGMTLKHPCVGLLQRAVIWGKAKEMLILENVLKSMPNVTFYWAGDGPYLEKILPTLEKYQNFKWLGSLQHPDKVRQYLSEIDVYALVSGLDMLGISLQEAQLMKKPVVATNTGGIPEVMKNNVTGFLVEKGNSNDWIEKLSLLVNDEQKRKTMGESGRKFVEENFNSNKIAIEFLEILKKQIIK